MPVPWLTPQRRMAFGLLAISTLTFLLVVVTRYGIATPVVLPSPPDTGRPLPLPLDQATAQATRAVEDCAPPATAGIEVLLGPEGLVEGRLLYLRDPAPTLVECLSLAVFSVGWPATDPPQTLSVRGPRGGRDANNGQ